MKTVTPAQATILVASLAAVFAAYKFLDSMAAGTMVAMVGMVINFMLGRENSTVTPPVPQPDTKPEFKVIDGGKQ